MIKGTRRAPRALGETNNGERTDDSKESNERAKSLEPNSFVAVSPSLPNISHLALRSHIFLSLPLAIRSFSSPYRGIVRFTGRYRWMRLRRALLSCFRLVRYALLFLASWYIDRRTQAGRKESTRRTYLMDTVPMYRLFDSYYDRKWGLRRGTLLRGLFFSQAAAHLVN